MYRRTLVTVPALLLLGGTALAKDPNLVTERSKEIAAPSGAVQVKSVPVFVTTRLVSRSFMKTAPARNGANTQRSVSLIGMSP